MHLRFVLHAARQLCRKYLSEGPHYSVRPKFSRVHKDCVLMHPAATVADYPLYLCKVKWADKQAAEH